MNKKVFFLRLLGGVLLVIGLGILKHRLGFEIAIGVLLGLVGVYAFTQSDKK
jgi:hypothetical protein